MKNYRVNAENVLAERDHNDTVWGYKRINNEVKAYNDKFVSGLDRYVRKETK